MLFPFLGGYGGRGGLGGLDDDRYDDDGPSAFSPMGIGQGQNGLGQTGQNALRALLLNALNNSNRNRAKRNSGHESKQDVRESEKKSQ